jgi:hypothetical protein
VLGPGTSIFARDDTSVPRQPSLFAVPSVYVVERQQAAAGQQMVMTALTAGVAIAVIYYVGKKK